MAPAVILADMYLVDWLDRKGFVHDIATDEDLDAEGLGLLGPYSVVVLGSYPEYFSRTMRAAMEEYVGRGGRLMNLGGNGCWWVTSRTYPEYFSRTMRAAMEEYVGRGGRLMNLGGNGCWWVTSRTPCVPMSSRSEKKILGASRAWM